MKKIDTHLHLFYPERFTYSWTADFPELQQPFHLEDYRAASADCGVEGALFMEVDVDTADTRRETDFFSDMAGDPSNGILGIVASGRPEESGFEAHLDSIRSPALKGLRRVLHTQPDDLSQSSRFRSNLATLAGKGLTFDLCVTQKQLTIALDLVRACPDVSFILDHCGVPSIAEHTSADSESWQQWQGGIRALAKLPNVACKFSGITAYASPEQRNADGLRPYLSEILAAFGSERIVWGSDWPVCNLADGLQRWSEITDQLLAELSPDEQARISIENAKRIYRIQTLG